MVGKVISLFVSKTATAENENTKLKPEIEVEAEPEEAKKRLESPLKEFSGWESEPISDEPPPPPLEVPSSNVTAKVMKRQFRRKCISVGPVMLTPNSQIIRTLNVEEREERYRYDILPLDTNDETTTAENVCVPCAFVSR